MLVKTVFDRVMSGIRQGALEVDFWEEEVKTYGSGKPYFRLKINDPKALGAIVRTGDLGFGEAYAEGRVEVQGDLDQVARLVDENEALLTQLGKLSAYRLNRNSKSHQPDQISHHYDVGNDFYERWLDKTMTYTCAYFRSDSDSLEDAQKQKIEHVLRKAQLQPGQTLVDMGCGWGHLVVTAAKKYGAKGLGVTLSKEQHRYAVKLARDEGVENLARFELLNYQDLMERGDKFDRVVSVGLLEHVGQGNHRQYFKTVDHLLKLGGISVLHSITKQDEMPVPRWLDKYIFPGGYIPSLREIIRLLPEFGFRLTDYENLRMHYAKTCDEWLSRFDAQHKWVVDRYDEKFYRMWRLYLAGSSASFRYGGNDLSQLVFTKGLNNDLPLTRDFLYKK